MVCTVAVRFKGLFAEWLGCRHSLLISPTVAVAAGDDDDDDDIVAYLCRILPM